MQLGHQLLPLPIAFHSQETGQADGERVERWWAQLAFEALSEIGTPGAEVEQTQRQIKIVQSGQIRSRANVLRGQPAVERAAHPTSPDAGGLHGLGAQR